MQNILEENLLKICLIIVKFDAVTRLASELSLTAQETPVVLPHKNPAGDK